MKIRLLVNEKERKKITNELKKDGHIIDDVDYDYTLVSNETVDRITGYKGKEIFLINPDDVLYFESFGNEIVCHTSNLTCAVKYKLYEIENLFQSKSYMRVSNSYIVNLNQIKSIKPTFNSKFILTMNNNDKVDVTRSYYALFKNYIEGGRNK